MFENIFRVLLSRYSTIIFHYINMSTYIILYSYQDRLRKENMESISPCEDLQTIKNHILLKDGEEEIQNQVCNSLLKSDG